MSYAIFTDVNTDLNAQLREKYGIEYVKGHMTLPDGAEIYTALDWSTAAGSSSDEFYRQLKLKPNDFKTAPASAEEVVSAFEPTLKAGEDILAICISSALSATYNITINAAKKLQSLYPERKVSVVDSRRYSVAEGLLAVKASELRAAGLSLEDNVIALEKLKNKIHQIGTVDDLKFVAAKGRITAAKAFMGTLVGVKPMGDFDNTGLVTVLGKWKGYDKAYAAAAEYVKHLIENPEEQTLFIANTLRAEQAELLASIVKEAVKPKEIIMTDIFPANGTNIGPGLAAVYFIGSEITDLENEKSIMNRIIAAQ